MNTPSTIDALAELAWQERRSGTHVNRERIDQLLAYAKTHAAPQYAAIANILKALSDFYASKYDEALAQGHTAVEAIARYCPAPWPARSLYIYGLLLSAKNLLAEALQQWKKGLELARACGDTEIIGFCLYNLGDMNRGIFRRYDLAKHYYKEGLKLCYGKAKHPLCGPLLMGLSRSELAEGETETSLVHAERALALALEGGDDRAIGLCYEFAGSRYRDLGQYEKAAEYLDKCLENRLVRDDQYGLVNANCALSVLKSHVGDYAAAKVYIDRAVEIYVRLETHVLDDMLYEQLAKVSEALGVWPEAAKYYRLYAEARNKSINKELEDLMTVLAAEFQLESARKDAEIHKLKNVELQAKNHEISQLATELEQALEDLKETQGELVRTSRLNGLLGVITGIAHEINTPLGNCITWSSFLETLLQEIQASSSSLSEHTRQEFDSAIHHLATNLAKVSKIVESLKKLAITPENLHYQTSDLKGTLEEWIQEARLRYTRLHIETVSDLGSPMTCRYEKSSLFKILDELMENIAQHAYESDASGDVRIELRKQTDSLQLVIKDFGCGMTIHPGHDLFEPFRTLRAPTSGLGLGLHLVYLLMVNVLLGHVTIASQVGSGTQVTLLLPISAF